MPDGAVLTDDQFKGLFENKGGAGIADLPNLPNRPKEQSPLPDLPAPGPGKGLPPGAQSGHTATSGINGPGALADLARATRSPETGPPLPKGAVMSDDDFQKTFGKDAAPAEEGVTGTRQGYNPNDFNFQPKLGQDNELLRAQDQGWLKQLGKTVGNTIVNIPLDVIQALGYTGTLIDGKHDYTNGLVDVTEAWKNPFGEVYREHGDQTFDLADSAWWLNNIGGLTEGIAQFAIPGEAEAAGIGAATKALASGLKLGKGAIEGMMTAGHVLSSAHMAYLMAASSGRQVYNEAYDANYHRLMAQGMDPYTSAQQAKEIASQAAATTVQTSTMLNSLLGMGALAPLFHTNENKIAQWLENQGARQEGESLEQWRGRLNEAASDPSLQEALKMRHGLSSYPAQAAEMSLMGLNNEYAEKKGRETGSQQSAKSIDVLADYFDKVSDKEGAMNVLMGIVSGPGLAMILDRAPIHRVIKYDSDGKPLYKNDPNLILKEGEEPKYMTQRVSARTRDAMGNQQFFDNMKDAINKDVDWFSSKNTELAAATKAGDNAKAEWLRQEMFAVNNLHAVSMGLGDNWKKEYEDIAGLDNTKDLGQQMQLQIDAITKAIGEAAQQGQDVTPLTQQLSDLQTRQKALNGRTEAMDKGFSRGKDDNEYKSRAQRSVSNLDWMKQRYDNIRAAYITPTDPRSEELAYHLFARESELHLQRQTLDDERASIARDESIVNPLTNYRSELLLQKASADHLASEQDRLMKAVKDIDFEGLRKMMGEYGIPAYGDNMLNKGIHQLYDKLDDRIKVHNQKAKEVEDTLHADTGYDRWKETHSEGTFDDYLRHIDEQHPVDGHIQERKENLEAMEEQHQSRREELEKIKSSRGIAEFLKQAADHQRKWKKETEERNQRDNVAAFMKQQDLTAADRIRKVQLQQEGARLKEEIRGKIQRENEVKEEINRLQTRLQQLAGDRTGTFRRLGRLAEQGVIKAQLHFKKEELARLQAERASLESQHITNDGKTQEAAVSEVNSSNLTRDQVQNHTQAEPEPGTQPENKVPPPAPATPPVEEPGATGQHEKAIEDYVGLKDNLTTFPELQGALDNLEILQDPHHYSYDMARKALAPYVENGTIPEETAHDIILKQKSYLEHQAAEAFNAAIPVQDLSPTVLPPALEPPVEAMTQDDITGPGEPFSPLVTMQGMPTPEESMQIDAHQGAKALSSMKVNVASIQYMEVVKQRGGQTVHQFLPLYDKLDPTFNKNILKPNFIQQGDDLIFQVDTNWKGKINYDRSLAVDDFGDPIKKEDDFSRYTDEGGKIKMSTEDPRGVANVPIKIVHQRSGETIGYLPRTDWITASYGAGYRNVADAFVDADGNEITGNVEAQKQKLLTVRRIIATAHNAGAEPIRSKVAERDSAGHPFYSTDVNRNTERSKLKTLTAKTLLPDPHLTFGIMNKGTVFTGYNTPLEGPKNFTGSDLSKYGKPGKEASNIPMVVLPMPNGRHSVSPLYTKSLGERPADIHTIARVIEAYLTRGTTQHTEAHTKWTDAILKATGQGGSKALDITNARDLESFINQQFTYTRHFTAADTAFNTGGKGQFMLDIEEGGQVKIGNAFSGRKPLYASLGPDGKLSPVFEQALTEGLATHYKNVVYTRGDIKGVNDSRPLHAVTITREGVARTNKFDNYNEYLKSFAETIIYGKHQAEDGTYLYGANSTTNFDFNQIANTRIGMPTTEAKPGPTLTPEEDDIFSQMINGAPQSIATIHPAFPHIEEARPVTLDNLEQLRTFTRKGESYNGKTTEEVMKELHDAGITELSPRLNPFIKC